MLKNQFIIVIALLIFYVKQVSTLYKGRKHKNEDNHRENHNRHSNINLSAILVCNFTINNDNVLLSICKMSRRSRKRMESSSPYMDQSFQKR